MGKRKPITREAIVKGRMMTLTVKIPAAMLAFVDSLIRKGYFATRSDFIRYVVRKCLEMKCWEDIMEMEEPEIVYVDLSKREG